MMTCITCKFMLCDNRPIERVSLCVSASQAPEREKKNIRISIAVNVPMHVHDKSKECLESECVWCVE